MARPTAAAASATDRAATRRSTRRGGAPRPRKCRARRSACRSPPGAHPRRRPAAACGVRGAERQTHRQFAAALSHGARHHPEQPHGHQQQGADREAANQYGADAWLTHRVVHDLVHRPDLRDGDPRIHLQDRTGHFGNQRFRFALRANDEARGVRRPVLCAEVHLWPAILMEVVEPCLLHDADDRQRLPVEGERRAERRASGRTGARAGRR